MVATPENVAVRLALYSAHGELVLPMSEAIGTSASIIADVPAGVYRLQIVMERDVMTVAVVVAP